MKLCNYKSLNEKNNYFYNKSVEDAEEFWNILTDIQKINIEDGKNSFVFRGLPNAKFKLYNSAQRFVIEYGIFKYKENKSTSRDSSKYMNWMIKFTDELVASGKVWKKGVIKKYISPNSRSDESDESDEFEYFSYLSYLRHHNVPVPVIDVTFNPFVALYFALTDFSKNTTGEEIDNYFSLYFIDLQLMNMCEKEHGQLHTFDSMLNRKFQTLRNVQISSMLNNLNIINQEGCLISNISIDPLEIDYENIRKIFTDNSMISKRLKDELINRRIISCYNIHKCTIPYFKQKLNKMGVIEDFLFPNPYSLKDDIIDRSIVKFLST